MEMTRITRTDAATWQGLDPGTGELMKFVTTSTQWVSLQLARQLLTDAPTEWLLDNTVEMMDAVVVVATSGDTDSALLAECAFRDVDIVVEHDHNSGTGNCIFSVLHSPDGGTTWLPASVYDVVAAGWIVAKTLTADGQIVLRVEQRYASLKVNVNNDADADVTVSISAYARFATQ